MNRDKERDRGDKDEEKESEKKRITKRLEEIKVKG